MSLKWFVEKDVFSENEDKLSSILGDRLTFVKNSLSDSLIVDMEGNPILEKGIFYGSIHLGRRLQKHGFLSFLSDDVFDCSTWLPRFGPLAVNFGHTYIEAGCFESFVKNFKFEFGDFFVKQDKGYKSFTGQVYNDQTLSQIKSDLFDNDMLLIAPIQKIGREFRFVVVSDFNNENYSNIIITGSKYPSDDDKTVPESALYFAQKTVAGIEYYPSQLWTIDICELSHEGSERYSVVEPNSLLTAGWYDCDIQKIIEQVEKNL